MNMTFVIRERNILREKTKGFP